MDLSEVRAGSEQRHPWETARADALERILRERSVRPRAILDVGCGDGFTGERLREAFGARELWGVDVFLKPEQIAARSRGDVHYVNELSRVTSSALDLGLLCDVIEHVEDDSALIASVLSRLAPNGQLLITVPSFQALFSQHDVALRHHRRYSLPQLRAAVAAAGAELVADGYLFASLLPLRVLAKLKERLLPRPPRAASFGVGGWSAPPLVTRALSATLRVDNEIMLSLSSGGLKPPGLSAWALCKPRP